MFKIVELQVINAESKQNKKDNIKIIKQNQQDNSIIHNLNNDTNDPNISSNLLLNKNPQREYIQNLVNINNIITPM